MLRILLATLLSLPLHAATRTWTGAVDAHWSNAGNWDSGAPVAGDDLVFTSYAGASTFNDYPAGTAFRSILASAGPWTFEGNAVTLTHGIASQTATFALPIKLGAPQQWTAVCCHTVSFTGHIDLDDQTLTLRTNVNAGGVGFVLSGAVRSGTLLLSGGSADLGDADVSVRAFEMLPHAIFVAASHPVVASERVRLAGEMRVRHAVDGMILIRNDGSTQVEGRFDIAPPGVTYIGGDGNDVGLQTTLITTVTTLTSSANPASAGVPVKFTARVVSDEMPSGTVTFRDGDHVLATVPLSASAEAAFKTSALSAGTHRITATYDGSATHAASASGVLVQLVQGRRRRAVRVSSAIRARTGVRALQTLRVRRTASQALNCRQ